MIQDLDKRMETKIEKEGKEEGKEQKWKRKSMYKFSRAKSMSFE